MLSLLTIASLLLTFTATVLAEGLESQEQAIQVLETIPAVIQPLVLEELEKGGKIPQVSNDVCTSERQPDKCPNDIAILQPDAQWHRFVFGKAGSTVTLKFVANLRAPALLDITDLFCPGDAFRVLDNGKNLGRTPLKRADGCKVKTSNPDVAFESDTWSHRSFELGKGKHVIEIKVIRSPYCGGAGAIRLNPILYTCLSSDSGHGCTSSKPIKCSSSEPIQCTSEPVKCTSESVKCTSEPVECTTEPVKCTSSSSEPVICPSSSSSESCTSSSSEPVRCSSSSSSEPVRCTSESSSSESCSSSDHNKPKPCGEFTVITSRVPFCEAEQSLSCSWSQIGQFDK